jgi:ankyrin repeat protein
LDEDVTRLRTLVKYGANINAPNIRGETALYYAVKGDGGNIYQLLDNGADPNIAADDGLTPIYFAVKYNQEQVVEILINAGGPQLTFASFRWR